ncbi:MAG TPA: hypothetical protein VF720_07790 [Candidatus Eisenbacteria bacterium]
MFTRKRTPWLAAVALGAVLALAGGCGDDDDDDGDGGNGDFELRDGTYSVAITTTLSGTGQGCSGTEGPLTLQFPFCGVDDPGDVAGGEDGEMCDVDGDEDDFEFHCTSADTVGGCIYTLHSNGQGSFEDDNFTMTITSFETVSPTTPPCSADPCTTTTTLTGTWLNSSCAGAPAPPLRSMIRTARQLAGGH